MNRVVVCGVFLCTATASELLIKIFIDQAKPYKASVSGLDPNLIHDALARSTAQKHETAPPARLLCMTFNGRLGKIERSKLTVNGTLCLVL